HVDRTNRQKLRANHSATHLLHAALRRALGPHVHQKRSLVGAERLRFDMTQPVPLTPENIAQVEADVNAQVRRNIAVRTLLMTPEAAVKQGAMALFGEKYGAE